MVDLHTQSPPVCLIYSDPVRLGKLNRTAKTLWWDVRFIPRTHCHYVTWISYVHSFNERRHSSALTWNDVEMESILYFPFLLSSFQFAFAFDFLVVSVYCLHFIFSLLKIYYWILDIDSLCCIIVNVKYMPMLPVFYKYMYTTHTYISPFRGSSKIKKQQHTLNDWCHNLHWCHFNGKLIIPCFFH